MMHIITWLWDGWRPVYDRKHVNALAAMLREYGPRDARLLCITDMHSGRFDCETAPLWPDPTGWTVTHRVPNCYRRLKLFDVALQEQLSISRGDHVVSIDLDTVILGDLTHMLTLHPDSEFVATQGLFSRYNVALWRLTAGAHTDVWDEFDYATSSKVIRSHRLRGEKLVGSDQAWLSLRIDNAPTWNTTDGLYNYGRHACIAKPGTGLLWNFAGGAKPWDDKVRALRPDLAEQYACFYGK